MEALSSSDAPTGVGSTRPPSTPMHNQQALFTIYIGELDEPDPDRLPDAARRRRPGRSWTSPSASSRAPRRWDVAHNVIAADWRQTADRALDDIAAENTKLANAIGARATAYAMGLLWRAP